MRDIIHDYVIPERGAGKRFGPIRIKTHRGALRKLYSLTVATIDIQELRSNHFNCVFNLLKKYNRVDQFNSL